MTLTYSAPRRYWRQTFTGDWASEPWDKGAVLLIRSGGGWFSYGQHDFADSEASKAAFSIVPEPGI